MRIKYFTVTRLHLPVVKMMVNRAHPPVIYSQEPHVNTGTPIQPKDQLSELEEAFAQFVLTIMHIAKSLRTKFGREYHKIVDDQNSADLEVSKQAYIIQAIFHKVIFYDLLTQYTEVVKLQGMAAAKIL